MQDYEVSLLRLLESITNGTVIEISYTGTTIAFKPGFIAGSPVNLRSHQHDCPLSKPIGYFLEPLLLLAAFGKVATNIVLSGITSGGSHGDPSIDLLRVGLLPILKRFGIEDYELRVPPKPKEQLTET